VRSEELPDIGVEPVRREVLFQRDLGEKRRRGGRGPDQPVDVTGGFA